MTSQSKRPLLILAVGLGIAIYFGLRNGHTGQFNLSRVNSLSVLLYALVCGVVFWGLRSELVPRKLLAVFTMTGTMLGLLAASSMNVSKSISPLYGIAGFAIGALPGIVMLLRKPPKTDEEK